MGYDKAVTLTSFQTHYDQTLSVRKQHSTDGTVVASALQRFQNAATWPRTGIPLPERLQKAVKKQEFNDDRSQLSNTLCVLGFFIGLAMWPLGIALTITYHDKNFDNDPWSEDEEDPLREKAAFIFLPIGFVLMVASCCLAARGKGLKTHVGALHLLYVESEMPVADARQEVFQVKVYDTVYKVYSNGDTDSQVVRSSSSSSAHRAGGGFHGGGHCDGGFSGGGGGGGGGGGCDV